MVEETKARFLGAVASIEPEMRALGFVPEPPIDQGFATRVAFRGGDREVVIYCGPPEYHVELSIRVGDGADAADYELADLMGFPVVADWVRNNPPVGYDDDSVGAETRWFAKLLRFVLPKLPV